MFLRLMVNNWVAQTKCSTLNESLKVYGDSKYGFCGLLCANVSKSKLIDRTVRL